MLERKEINEAKKFINDRWQENPCDRQQAELYLLEAQCYQVQGELGFSDDCLKLAFKLIKTNHLKGPVVCFYYCVLAEQMIMADDVQDATKCLANAKKSAETDCQKGLILFIQSVIHYRQNCFKKARSCAKKAKKMLKLDCGILARNCRAIIKLTGFISSMKFIRSFLVRNRLWPEKTARLCRLKTKPSKATVKWFLSRGS